VASHPHGYDRVFAIYPIVVAVVLVGCGDVSDYVGRRAAILWGVGASLFGTLLLALAPDVLWLFAGRLHGRRRRPYRGRVDRRDGEFSGQGAAKRAAIITTAAQPSVSPRPCCSAVLSFNMLRCPRG